MSATKFDAPSFVVASSLLESEYPSLPGYAMRVPDDGTEGASFVQAFEEFQASDGSWRQWAPVVNLTVTRETVEGKEILLCIRKQDDEVHPNVVSTPTMRIPAHFLMAILDQVPTSAEEPRFQKFDGFGFGGESFNHDRDEKRPINPFDFVAQTAMCAKLGAADDLAREKIGFFAYPGTLELHVVGATVMASGEDLLETVGMFTVAVDMTKGSGLFPSESAAHQKIFWAGTEAFGQAWATKDLSHILSAEDIVRYQLCIKGACVANSDRLLHGDKGIDL